MRFYHNLTIPKIKCVYNKYANSLPMKITGSSVLYNANGSYCKYLVFLKFQVKTFCYFEKSASLFRGFLTNELQDASYQLRVSIYCTSYELLFTYELRVTIYCTSYELLFAYELRVIAYCTSYELIFKYELRVTIYCTSYK